MGTDPVSLQGVCTEHKACVIDCSLNEAECFVSSIIAGVVCIWWVNRGEGRGGSVGRGGGEGGGWGGRETTSSERGLLISRVALACCKK